MKLYLPCMECQIQNGIPSFEFHPAEINNDFYFVTKCNQGHTTITILQEERFELLFDFGCSAFLDGYYRESVSSIAVAIERFHEFFIKVMTINQLFKKKQNSLTQINETATTYITTFNKTIWNNMEKQSERQLGAFYLTYFNEFNSTPPRFIIDNKTAQFRNNTIHKGYIPTKEEANDYMKNAFNYIIEVLKPLKENHSKSISLLTLNNLTDIRKKATSQYKGSRISTMAKSSFINLISGESTWASRTFEDTLNQFIQNQKVLNNHFQNH